MNAKIITISNVKGGVGKSTTAFHLIEGLRKRGFKVLAIDLDQQTNLSLLYDFDTSAFTSYDLFRGIAIKNIIQNDLVPSSIMVDNIEHELTKIGKEFVLKKALAEIIDKYDYIVIDTHPSTGLVNLNCYIASDYVILPTRADAFNVHALRDCFDFVEGVNEYYSGHVEVAGILFTQYSGKGALNQAMYETLNEIAETKKAPVFKTYIRDNTAIREAIALRQSVYDYKPASNGAIDYNAFVDEFLERMKSSYNKSKLVELMNQIAKKQINLQSAFNTLNSYSLESMIDELKQHCKNSSNITKDILLEMNQDESKMKVILFFVVYLKREFTNKKYISKVVSDKLSNELTAEEVFMQIYKKEK